MSGLSEALRASGLRLPEGTGLLDPSEVRLGEPFKLGDIEVRVVASDSLGVRSMATFISTPDVNVFIDPSAALGPNRYGLEPHPLEEETLRRAMNEIRRFLELADVVIITHYHFDHHSPELKEFYRGRRLLVKDGTAMTNKSQMGRAKAFLSDLEHEVCDGRTYELGRTKVIVSQPVPHGPNPRLGYVLEVAIIRGDDRLLFTSDVQGFLTEESLELPLQVRPQLIIADGPPTYMLGTKFSPKSYKTFKENVSRLMEELSPDLSYLVLDHHLTRDRSWYRRTEDLRALGKSKGVRLLTAAELVGVRLNTMEALRRELYQLVRRG